MRMSSVTRRLQLRLNFLCCLSNIIKVTSTAADPLAKITLVTLEPIVLALFNRFGYTFNKHLLTYLLYNDLFI